MTRPFRQVDVFTTEPYLGNPVAVVLEADGLTTGQMQRFARWTNLSETTFVLTPTTDAADYRVRIFTPSQELPFAGHPTLGTCHAWLEHSGATPSGEVVQECGVGLVRIRPGGLGRAFAAPPLIRSGPVDAALLDRVAGILGLAVTDVVAAEWVDNGPGWLAVLLESADDVLALRPGPVGELDIGVVGPYPPGSPEAVEVRAFFPVAGATVEDPVTGSLNASVAQWLIGNGRLTAPYLASQGTALGRRGRVQISQDADGTIWVGGGAVTCVSGQVEI
jgi:PhzF family phenazine biosynthesis protein